MPQGRRKIPFSGKAKRQQLQAKKQRQQQVAAFASDSEDESISPAEYEREVQRIRKPHTSSKDITQLAEKKMTKNRYALQFYQESAEELRKRKEEAYQSIKYISLKNQEISDNYFPPEINMPKRPPWDYKMTKEELEMRERKYFTEYLSSIQEFNNLSYFELNLETWRQLWRVLEMSDIVLIIVDIRFPVLMFPPYLYNYVTNELGKDMILVLNKIDLAPPALVVAWREYFRSQYPKLHILMFTSYPTYNLRGNTEEKNDVIQNRRRKAKLKMAAEGAQKLLESCKDIVKDNVDFSEWEKKIQEEMKSEYYLDDIDHKDKVTIEKSDTTYFLHEKYKNGMLTIGCVGTPNAGKSSLMNALMGRKTVSVSRTPGHTKHFQTIFLTSNVCLCDCPGLVFPSTVPKQLQILMGSFPIAQVREPYTTVQFLAERLQLPRLLNISHPHNDDTWSAMNICEGWAMKRNFTTARAARLDMYRAANSILRMALEGKICLHTYPPNWTVDKEKWENHENIEMVRWIQARNQTDDCDMGTELISSEDDETYSEYQTYTGSSEDVASICSTGSSEKNSVPSINTINKKESVNVANKFAALSVE